MKTIQRCDDTVTEGALVQWASDTTLTLWSDGDLAGVANALADVSLSSGGIDGEQGEVVRVAELTLHGDTVAKLVGTLSRRGGALYRSGHLLSATPNGAPIARAIPADLGVEADFVDGELVRVVLL